jgi:lipoyl synthase
MAKPSADVVWKANPKELSRLLDSGVLVFEPHKIQFYAPSFVYYKTRRYHSSPADFPTVSVTGKGCTLNCKHCGGKVLETMHPANSPEKLLEVCTELKQKGALGCLISGGCLPDGSVTLEKFIPVIAKIKRDLGLTILVHTGIINFEMAKQLKKAGVDAALIDIIGSDETIREIYNLDTTVKDYAKSLKALQEAGIDFVPHVIVGLHHGELKGEFTALNMISQYKPSAVVIISFMPIRGTAMATIKPPTPADIARVTATARTMFPKTPVVLGCMRPKGKHRAKTDVFALKAGVNAIAFPSEEAIKYAEAKGYTINFSSYCCSQIYKDSKT